MTTTKRAAGLALGVLTAGLLFGSPAWAQSGDSDSVTSRLIELLVKRGVLARDDASALLAEAKAEKPHPTKRAAKSAAPVASVTTPPAAPDTTPETAPPEEPVAPGTVRVTYVPQIVRDQIAQQVREEMMADARNGEPEQSSGIWDRFHFFGDLRLREELDQLPGSNAQLFPNFAAVNGGSAFDINSGPFPQLDTTQNRSQVRLRARAGVDVKIDDGLTVELRLATGNDASPVSANQTFGQNGPFTKYAVWVARAFVKAAPNDWFTAYAGRMPNPFWTTDLIYYDEIGFDGFAASATPRFDKTMSGFLTAGAFPVFNTAFNFGSASFDQSYPSTDGWLFAVQAGGEWQAAKQISTKFGAGYFDYSGISGKISSPCTLLTASDSCNTDDTRALFPGNGNTLIPLRNLVSAPGTTQPQYFGLATPFRILDLHGRVDFQDFSPIIVSLENEFAINLAFDRARAVALGVNNFGANANSPSVGNKAWMVRVNVGTPQITQRWDWNVSLAYKYLESDSVLASLNDPDFHLGGTNAKGFILAANLGLARNTWVTAKWFRSTQVSGAPYTVETIQADLNVRF